MSASRRPAIVVLGLSGALLAGAALAQPTAYHRLSGPDVIWTRKPSGADMGSLFPSKAMQAGRGGAAVLECLLTPKGGVADCVILAETEPDFGKASLKVTPKFGFDVRKMTPDMLAGAVVTLPISWGAPDGRPPLTPEYRAGGRPYLITPKADGKVPCATKAAPDQHCDIHDLTWEKQPSLEETAPQVRMVHGGPDVTSLLCSTRPDRQLDGCEAFGAPTAEQLDAMDQLAKQFVAKAEADDKTPVTHGRVLLRFNWPVLRRAVDASHLSPPAQP
ncbi:energy transducer TonB [Caulobacter hibisci]|uniref:Energy transducer TonB n=1 Tax=Caulobacter hibisci TaxID=2035993 RepID=A0ABS0SST2_9CAUL|nr:energy transducer TonB [Caulobacter hibisci]MBI1682246.1 energy transducer TonB [Caulobacter hibisci]